jgi:RimJ/RimL family protein N-acetyltransferase
MIETSRLSMRVWREEDVAELLRVTNTPRVMEHFGGVQPAETFDAAYARMRQSLADDGFCFWILERRQDGAILGICGLKRGTVEPIMDEIEIGWRLREDCWGQGYAREAAEASLAWAWANLACAKIFAITVPGNARSWGLMERLGMRRRRDLDFAHPNFAADHPLSAHITYEIARPPA